MSKSKNLEGCPRISIVTPSFNKAQFLEQTILSVLSQNYPNLEYIIIDGGSTDGSVEIIKKYSDHLFYWVSENDKGMYDAIQKGFDKSTGEIMAWLNADDMYWPTTFRTVSKLFTDLPEVSWVEGTNVFINEDDIVIDLLENGPWSKVLFHLKVYKWIQQESTFWRRSLWETSGGLKGISSIYAGDFELWVRFFKREKLYNVNALLGAFRFNQNQLSARYMNSYLLEVDKVLTEAKILSKDKSLKAKVLLHLYTLLNRDFFTKFKKLFKPINQKIINKLELPQKVYFDRFADKFILKDRM